MAQLKTAEKLSFGVADVGATLTFVAINTWLLYFLINIAGLEPLLAGLVFMIGRVFDAITDPIMGIVSDRLKPKIGRKPFIAWGAVPLGISFALLWQVPEASQLVKFGLATLAFMLFSLLYTIVQMPYMALIPELAEDYDERTSLSSYRAAFGTFASLLAVAVPPVIVGMVYPGVELAQTFSQGWLIMGAIFGLVTAASYLLMVIGVKEPRRVQASIENPDFLSEFRSAFKIFGFRQIFVLFIVITIGMMIVNSILPFFLESYLRITGTNQSVVLGTLFLVAIVVFPLWNTVAARLGKKTALILGLILLAGSLLLLVGFTAPGKISIYLMLMTALAGVGLSAVLLFPWAMLPDVVEFDQLHTGRRREGLVYALFTFGQKIAGSIGVFTNAIVASVFGYQQGALEQSATTILALRWMAGPVAALIFLLSIVFVWRFPITRAAHEEARLKLNRP
jgi:glycoside/pentoside/hexuronide:cation symporter, GPH family